MKKVLVSILAIYYLAVTCGVVINMHYCMDRLASSTLYISQGKKCDRCGMEIHRSGGCCRDEVQIVKLDENQQKSTNVLFEIAPLAQPEIVPSEYIVAAVQDTPGTRYYLNHSPPLLSAQDTYLQNSVFRI